ncbi:MAG TPA: hypothetical protein VFR12_04535, partial [Pyrinomonadaceae bacterium]|nr:hypothetical protein [Pyrinomonadaceae bacterium]
MPLKIQYSGFQFPYRIVGLALIAIAVLGFVYVFYPEQANVKEIDVGTILAGESSDFPPGLRDRR